MALITVKSVFSHHLWLLFCQRSTRQLWLTLVRTRFLLSLVLGVFILSFFYLSAIQQDNDHQPIYPQLLLNGENSNQQQTAVITDYSRTNDILDNEYNQPPLVNHTLTSVLLLASGEMVSHQRQDNVKPTTSSSSFKSVCGRSADERGPHQKVIGYSIYGDFSKKKNADRYVEPLRQTIKAIPSAYPGWIVRIHHNLKREEHETSSWKILEKAVAFASHVDMCNVTEIAGNQKLGRATLTAMLWRWLPLLDGLVDAFMSRDSDSLILPREQDAVAEWLASDRIFHIMRDHPAHCIVMLGGLWGVKLAQNRPKIKAAFQSLLNKEKHYSKTYFLDQRLLKKYIWPIAQTNHMAHDSYCCQRFAGLGIRPFPSQRSPKMEFVGQIQQNNHFIHIPCPKQCRPVNVKPEWMYC